MFSSNYAFDTPIKIAGVILVPYAAVIIIPAQAGIHLPTIKIAGVANGLSTLGSRTRIGVRGRSRGNDGIACSVDKL